LSYPVPQPCGDALKEYVRIAAKALGRERIAKEPIAKPPRQLREERATFWRSRNENARRHVLYAIRLARLVAERYNLPLEGFGDFRFEDLKDSSAAIVTSRGNSYFIEIDLKYRDDCIGLLSVLAHEFAHVFLARANVRLPDKQRNEELTDTIAALAGFGPVMKKACMRVRTESLVLATIQTTHYLGYLFREDLAWLCRIQARIKDRNPLRRMRSTIDPEQHDFSPCPACGSHLRLPQRSAAILITCPRCGFIQQLRLLLGADRQRRNLVQRLLDYGRRWFDDHHGVPEP
jgi:hypothetical protein